MRFEEALTGWRGKRLTQAEAAQLLGVHERTFRRYIDRYEEEGLDGLIDKRLSQVSARRAPVDEVLRLEALYQERYDGWNVKHFHSFYRRRHEGTRSYTWVKTTLQKRGLVQKAPGRGQHRKRRARAPLPGMLIHQDGSTHEWAPGKTWDLIVTMDDATSEPYSMFFVEQEGTASSLRGVAEVIRRHGLFCSFYSDRGSHYWLTPEAGGKVDKTNLTQFGQALARLGIEMIAAYSPEARGRSERAFATHQGRLPKELALAGITTMAAANRYLAEVYRPAFNVEFAVAAEQAGSAFVPWRTGQDLNDYLCERFERTVSRDNCVEFDHRVLQIPADTHRHHYVKAKVKVLRHLDGTLSLWHGPRRLARYQPDGQLITAQAVPVAA
ncbi:MAG: ISNCY family transposase [Terriglobales bacterium]